ncbi:Sodium/potassium-transporting ATPase subunit alpha-A [Grifola frondosa]|uniref:Sodium/potassium-transporting ATPase subunit alpha-A n=1 Tax=Grifola frondosa TaxID=5627 RepID=A0A1C7LN59_GRIFR|nr:Sodium/potassium-transporting ATPase subunit alpha-A [Grifola frondosa]
MERIAAMSGQNKFKLTTVQKEVWFFTKMISACAILLFIIGIVVWSAWLRKSFPGFETASEAIMGSPCLSRYRSGEANGEVECPGSDKSGTLTVGKMSLQDVAFLDIDYGVDSMKEKCAIDNHDLPPPALKPLHMVARLCNGATCDSTMAHLPIEKRAIEGDATDTAVLRFAESLVIPSLNIGTAAIVASYDKLFEIAFNSARDVDAREGHSGRIFPACRNVTHPDGTVTRFDPATRVRLLALQEKWAREGQRVLALCRRSLDEVKLNMERMSTNDAEELMYAELQELAPVGFVGTRDPPRSDVAGAITIIRGLECAYLWLRGTFKLTALAIARQVGIIAQEKVDTVSGMRASAAAKRFFTATPPEIKPLGDDEFRARGLQAMI